MNVIRHVHQLLALDDKALVEALYLTVLKREPDPEGLAFYVGQLRAGIDKASMIAEFASSPEARAAGLALPGLQPFIATQKAREKSIWRRLFGNRQHQSALNRIENALGRSSQHIEAELAQIRQRLAAIEDRVASIPQGAGTPSPAGAAQESASADDTVTPQRATGAEIDLMGVPLPVRRIFRELSAAVASLEKRQSL